MPHFLQPEQENNNNDKKAIESRPWWSSFVPGEPGHRGVRSDGLRQGQDEEFGFRYVELEVQ